MPPSAQRNPFEFMPREPDFFSPFPPARQHDFPPLFPVRGPEPAPPATPASSGAFSDLIGMFLSPGGRGGTGGANLFGMLTNVQKAIQTAQTVLPMIQQFGPLIRNAPAILSVLKSMPDTGSSSDAGTPPAQEENEPEEAAEAQKTVNADGNKVPKKEEKKDAPRKPDHTGAKRHNKVKSNNLRNSDEWISRPSRPKLYI
ncbi:VrrA/YqfQ family protein [Sporolactobacillus vineae]|uniref:VrrA/YqfQ family protein n=1 Tax=Sporolactobacillus vineae TaxID=444463 RepID=UPI000287C297|nr:VrrA/YqfQ family protein [Sporolactobacillus vineae]